MIRTLSSLRAVARCAQPLASYTPSSSFHTSSISKSDEMTNQEIVDVCKKHSFFSWAVQNQITPMVMERGEGVYFWAGGKRYIDFNSQLMCTNIGHGHPKVIQAIKDQAEELSYAGPVMATKVRAKLCPLLAKHTPGDLNKFFFTLGGAEANENAIKFAKVYTGRTKILARYRSYHGATHAALSLTGDSRRWAIEPGNMSGIVRLFDPDPYRSLMYREGDSLEEFGEMMLEQMEETIKYENPDSIAAVIMESVTGTNGLIVPPPNYLPGVRKLCDKYGIVMICDEVMAGVGRTGEWFAVDTWNVVPDMIVMAKGLTSAYMPLGCVAINDKISQYFDDKFLPGGLTYQGHPMCLAAAVACLEVMEEEKTVENAKKMGEVMKKFHQEMYDKHPSVGSVRNLGLLGGMELVKNRETKEQFIPYKGANPAMGEVLGYLRENGVFGINNPQGMLFTIPPLCINEDQMREAFEVYDKALEIADRNCEA